MNKHNSYYCFSEILMHQTYLYTDTPSDMNVFAPLGYIFGIYSHQVNERGHQLKLLFEIEIKSSQPHIIKHIPNLKLLHNFH